MRSFRHLKNENHFRADLGPNALRRDEALGGANICLVQVLQSAAAYLGFSDIDAELDKVYEQIKAPLSELNADPGGAPG